MTKATDTGAADWYLLVYRIPSEPTRLRAGVWRRLKGLGAMYVQNSVAALPASAASERALRTLRAEIEDMGGVAYLFASAAIAGQAQLMAAFNALRDDEYDEIIDRCDDFLRQLQKEYDDQHFTYAELEENDVDLAKLRGWLDKVQARDVFGAQRIDDVHLALSKCGEALDAYAARVYAEEGEGPGS